MKNISRLIASLLSVIVVTSLSISPISAVYFGTDANLNLLETDPINESAFVAGETLTVNSDINGDLICAGRNITINGDIKGDVICAGQTIKINGLVDGNVRVAAQDVEISGIVARNVSVISQNLVISQYSSVKGDIFFGVQQVDLRGSLGRDMAGAGEQININGSLFRNAKITATKIVVSNTGSIGGTLDYYMDESGTLTQSSPKSITGEVVRHEISSADKDAPKAVIKEISVQAIIVGKVISILSYILLAFLLIYFTPKKTHQIITIVKHNPVKMFFYGLGISIIAPFVIILMLITVVGMSSAFAVFLLYILSMFVSSLYSSAVIGQLISSKPSFLKTKSIYFDAALGCVVVGLAVSIPVVGWLLGLALYLSGLGATLISYLPEKK